MAFFSIPLDKLFTKIEFTPHSKQHTIIDAIEQHKFTVVAAGRRFGKSLLAANLAFGKSLEPNARIGIVAPNYNLSSIIFDEIAKIVTKTGMETVKFSYKDKYIELVNGSSIKALSAHRPDSLVGRGYDFLIVDEGALIPDFQDVWEMQLRPTVSDSPDSRVLFISSPRGRNYFKTLFDFGIDNDRREWQSFTAPTSDNPHIPKDDIEEARKTLSEARFRQEYLAEFVAFEGQIYGSVPVKDNVLKDINLDNCEVISGIDFGLKHSTACVLIATDGETYYVFKEYKEANKTTAEHAEWLTENIDKYHIETMYRDNAAAQSAFDLAYIYDISTVSSIKDIIPGITVVNSMFRSERLIVDSSCEQLLLELNNYRWKPKAIKEEPVKEHDDLCDALRYCVYTHSIRTPGITI